MKNECAELSKFPSTRLKTGKHRANNLNDWFHQIKRHAERPEASGSNQAMSISAV
jgi:hypothetical protein